jgi:TetR/AcrR family transcriptional repressor of nem operon
LPFLISTPIYQSIEIFLEDAMAELRSRERILDAAERRARTGGYNGFSFRDLAEDVGVKSSSVHYHFPTKAALGEALAKRYTKRARELLGDAKDISSDQAIERVTTMFRDALVVDDQMCLCGLFGAEHDALPRSVNLAVGEFFKLILEYLTTAFGSNWKGPSAPAVLACLEGALILARALGDVRYFEEAVEDLPRHLRENP